MTRKIKVKQHTRKGYCVKSPIEVKSHTREIETKKASQGSKRSPLDLSSTKKVDTKEYNLSSKNYDFSIRKEDDEWIVDVFDKNISNSNKAYVTSEQFDTYKEALRYAKEYEKENIKNPKKIKEEEKDITTKNFKFSIRRSRTRWEVGVYDVKSSNNYTPYITSEYFNTYDEALKFVDEYEESHTYRGALINLDVGDVVTNLTEDDLNIGDNYYVVDVKDNKIKVSSAYPISKEFIINKYYDKSHFSMTDNKQTYKLKYLNLNISDNKTKYWVLYRDLNKNMLFDEEYTSSLDNPKYYKILKKLPFVTFKERDEVSQELYDLKLKIEKEEREKAEQEREKNKLKSFDEVRERRIDKHLSKVKNFEIHGVMSFKELVDKYALAIEQRKSRDGVKPTTYHIYTTPTDSYELGKIVYDYAKSIGVQEKEEKR